MTKAPYAASHATEQLAGDALQRMPEVDGVVPNACANLSDTSRPHSHSMIVAGPDASHERAPWVAAGAQSDPVGWVGMARCGAYNNKPDTHSEETLQCD